jgi:hypothetical protein
MHERTRALGGSVELRRRRPEGTQVIVSLPARRVYADADECRPRLRMHALLRRLARRTAS